MGYFMFVQRNVPFLEELLRLFTIRCKRAINVQKCREEARAGKLCKFFRVNALLCFAHFTILPSSRNRQISNKEKEIVQNTFCALNKKSQNSTSTRSHHAIKREAKERKIEELYIIRIFTALEMASVFKIPFWYMKAPSFTQIFLGKQDVE